MDEVGLESPRSGRPSRARGITAPTIVNALVAAGFKGKHKGGGFYLYERGARKPNPNVRELLGTPAHPGGDNIAERLTLTFVNEAARCLDEGVLRSPAEGDLGAVLGLGFPPFLGGPFRYADSQRQRIVTALEKLAATRGERLNPTESLRSRRPYFEP